MHEKFSTQKSNKLQLELEVKDAEHRLATAKKSFTRMETTFQELNKVIHFCNKIVAWNKNQTVQRHGLNL